MEKIKTFKGKDGSVLLPRTHAKAVKTDDGGNVQDKLYELDGAVNELKELYGNDVEGYVRVSGISNPKFEYRSYKRGVGMESVFDVFKPCLVEQGTGKLLRVLDTLNWYKDEDGNDVSIDGSMGEVMVCNVSEYYHITGHVTVNSVEYDVFLRSFIPFEWQGHHAEKCEPFGLSPHYTVAHKDADNVTRMHSVYNPEWAGSYQAQKVAGAYRVNEDMTEEYDESGAIFGNAGGLASTNLSLYTGEQYAMNMNEDTTKPVPFFNRTAHGEELWFGHIVAEGGTFDAHNEALMGSGFSSNDPASNETYWTENSTQARNGFRYIKADGTWGYYAFSSNVNFGFVTAYAATLLNDWRTPWRIMEQQRVLMYANENNIPELTWFAFEGNKYKWRHIDGFAGPSEGAMTAVVFKVFASKLPSNTVINGSDVSGNRCEYLISSAVYRGVITDVSPSWWTSGLIFTTDENGNYEAYMQRGQSKLIISESGDKNVGDRFKFMDQYHHVASFTKGEGYRKNYNDKCIMIPDSNANRSGAALHTYCAAYNVFTSNAAGKISVRGFRRGGGANGSHLSPLCVAAGFAPSVAYSYIGFGTCVRLQLTESQTE